VGSRRSSVPGGREVGAPAMRVMSAVNRAEGARVVNRRRLPSELSFGGPCASARTMSMPDPQAPPSAPPHSTRWAPSKFVLILMVVLSAVGVAINDYSPSAFRYWTRMRRPRGDRHRGGLVARASATSRWSWRAASCCTPVIVSIDLSAAVTGRARTRPPGCIRPDRHRAGVVPGRRHSDWRLMVLVRCSA
jgi:hypothetical protein